MLVNTAAFVAQIFHTSERELECGIAMDESRESFINHGERIPEGNEECRRSGLGTLAFQVLMDQKLLRTENRTALRPLIAA